jgi:hypothetical protein
MIGVSGQRHDAADPAFVQQMNPISKAAIDQRNILMGLRVFIRTDAKPSKPGAKVPFYTTYFWSPAPSLQGADQGAEILRRLASAPNPIPYPTAPAPVAPPGYGAPQAYPPQAQPPAGPPGGYQPAYPVHPPMGQAPANPWGPPQGGWDPNAGRR